MTDESGAATAVPARHRYLRRDDRDRTFCLHCWSAARLREARESAGRLGRLAARQDATRQAVGGVLIAAAVLAVGAAAMAVVAGAWVRLGEVVLAGGN